MLPATDDASLRAHHNPSMDTSDQSDPGQRKATSSNKLDQANAAITPAAPPPVSKVATAVKTALTEPQPCAAVAGAGTCATLSTPACSVPLGTVLDNLTDGRKKLLPNAPATASLQPSACLPATACDSAKPVSVNMQSSETNSEQKPSGTAGAAGSNAASGVSVAGSAGAGSGPAVTSTSGQQTGACGGVPGIGPGAAAASAVLAKVPAAMPIMKGPNIGAGSVPQQPTATLQQPPTLITVLARGVPSGPGTPTPGDVQLVLQVPPGFHIPPGAVFTFNRNGPNGQLQLVTSSGTGVNILTVVPQGASAKQGPAPKGPPGLGPPARLTPTPLAAGPLPLRPGAPAGSTVVAGVQAPVGPPVQAAGPVRSYPVPAPPARLNSGSSLVAANLEALKLATASPSSLAGCDSGTKQETQAGQEPGVNPKAGERQDAVLKRESDAEAGIGASSIPTHQQDVVKVPQATTAKEMPQSKNAAALEMQNNMAAIASMPNASSLPAQGPQGPLIVGPHRTPLVATTPAGITLGALHKAATAMMGSLGPGMGPVGNQPPVVTTDQAGKKVINITAQAGLPPFSLAALQALFPQQFMSLAAQKGQQSQKMQLQHPPARNDAAQHHPARKPADMAKVQHDRMPTQCNRTSEAMGADDDDDDDDDDDEDDDLDVPDLGVDGTLSMGSGAGARPCGDAMRGIQGQTKRKAGRPILCDKDPNDANLSEEQRRVLKRRMSNREYARRARQRRQEMIKELQQEVGAIGQANDVLADEVRQEEKHRNGLKRQLHFITASLAQCVKENARLKVQARTIKEYMQMSGYAIQDADEPSAAQAVSAPAASGEIYPAYQDLPHGGPFTGPLVGPHGSQLTADMSRMHAGVPLPFDMRPTTSVPMPFDMSSSDTLGWMGEHGVAPHARYVLGRHGWQTQCGRPSSVSLHPGQTGQTQGLLLHSPAPEHQPIKYLGTAPDMPDNMDFDLLFTPAPDDVHGSHPGPSNQHQDRPVTSANHSHNLTFDDTDVAVGDGPSCLQSPFSSPLMLPATQGAPGPGPSTSNNANARGQSTPKVPGYAAFHMSPSARRPPRSPVKQALLPSKASPLILQRSPVTRKVTDMTSQLQSHDTNEPQRMHSSPMAASNTYMDQTRGQGSHNPGPSHLRNPSGSSSSPELHHRPNLASAGSSSHLFTPAGPRSKLLVSNMRLQSSDGSTNAQSPRQAMDMQQGGTPDSISTKFAQNSSVLRPNRVNSLNRGIARHRQDMQQSVTEL